MFGEITVLRKVLMVDIGVVTTWVGVNASLK